MTAHGIPAAPRPALTAIDRAILGLDGALRTLLPPQGRVAVRPSPAAGLPENPLTLAERRRSAALMRVNHSGEVCAQALYHGQGVTASSPGARAMLGRAAQEETDHLAWCAERVAQLESRTSVLDPVWYLGAFALGVLAGAAGDRWSLGFVVETERQVEAHLDGHLARLPQADVRSRAIVSRMKIDEAHHADAARAGGGLELPAPVRALMALQGRVMTTLAHRI